MNYKEPLRPQIHFSPKQNWMNDPNGCVYYKGVYHLFFQYNPHGTHWGPMHWGHAESRDLIHWEEKEIALYPNEKLGMAFSGSIVIDGDNLSGFFPEGEGLLAYYTNHLEMSDEKPGLQQQSLAWSCDEGSTWNEYEDNPIIRNPGINDFRDPKLFFHKPSEKWVMVVSAGYGVIFYGSKNLINWEKTGEFLFEDEYGIVECPDLLSFKTIGGWDVWFLVVSFITADNPENPSVRYFPGNFNGSTFILLPGSANGIVADYGRDFYAPQSWSGIPEEDGRKIWIGWCNHWAYSNQIPTESWRGVMSLPRELYLDETESAPLLRQLPVEELKLLRKGTEILKSIGKTGKTILLESEYSHEFLMNIENPSNCSLDLSFNYMAGEYLKLQWDSTSSLLILDRSGFETSTFNDLFAKHSELKIRESKRFEIRIILDRSIIEIYVMGGKYVMTSQVFPSHSLISLTLKTLCGDRIKDFIHHTLDSIWKNK